MRFHRAIFPLNSKKRNTIIEQGNKIGMQNWLLTSALTSAGLKVTFKSPFWTHFLVTCSTIEMTLLSSSTAEIQSMPSE